MMGEERVAELEKMLRAAEDRAAQCETEAQAMYEAANRQLQKSLEVAHERICQLERENGTLALALASLRAKDGDLLEADRPPVSPMKKDVQDE